jgi:cytochrome b6-f complex iron-sulfur subunit
VAYVPYDQFGKDRSESTAVDGDCSGCPLVSGDTVAIPLVSSGGLDRRTFLSRALYSAAAVALAACGVSDASTAPFTGSASLNISSYPSLATVGGVALATANGAPLALVRVSETSILALSRSCPHEGGRIDVNGSSGGFICARHGARFTLTGQWSGGQRTTNMRSYGTTFDPGTGAITVG